MFTLKCFYQDCLANFTCPSHSDSVKMAYACDKLYDEVIRKMMADLSTKVKVREIIVYLPCLTISDRVIYAKHCTKHTLTLCVLIGCLFIKRF